MSNPEPSTAKGAEAPQTELSVILDQIEQRANNATLGPWKAARWEGIECVFQPDRAATSCGRFRIAELSRSNNAADSDFIAAARSDVPALVKALRHALKCWGYGVNAEVAAILTGRAPSDPKGTEQDDPGEALAELLSETPQREGDFSMNAELDEMRSGETRAARANTVPVPEMARFASPWFVYLIIFLRNAGERVRAIKLTCSVFGLEIPEARDWVDSVKLVKGPEEEVASHWPPLVEQYLKRHLSLPATSGASAPGVSTPNQASAAQASVEGDDLILAEANKAADSITDCCKYALREFPSMRSDWTSIHKSLEAIVAASLLRVAQAVGSRDSEWWAIADDIDYFTHPEIRRGPARDRWVAFRKRFEALIANQDSGEPRAVGGPRDVQGPMEED